MFVGGGVLDAPQVYAAAIWDFDGRLCWFVGRGLDPSTGRYRKARPGRRGRRPLRLDFMFVINGKACSKAKRPGGGKPPPYSTILYGAFRPQRGQSGRRPKSVKKIAALLQFLAFGAADHIFGVPRGEQPLGRASRAIGSSGDLFGSFWVSKRNT